MRTIILTALAFGLWLWMCQPSSAGCWTSVTVTSASTQLLAANDLGTGGRGFLQVCNLGPSPIYWNIGTANVVTATTGAPLGPMDCSAPLIAVNKVGTVSSVPNGDVAAIAESNPGNAAVEVCDY